MRYKLIIEYDGTDFFGWQLQRKTGERTVQQVIQEALARLPNMTPTVWAAGRTDSGVHAMAMAAHCDGDARFSQPTYTRPSSHQPHLKLVHALNAHLPRDVRVLEASPVADDFHAQYSCQYRRYVYRLAHGASFAGRALERHFRLSIPQHLDVEAMQAAAPLLLGEHDFAAFATRETRATVRHIYHSEIRKTADGRLEYHVAANGFLRNMVRAIVGTLIEVGLRTYPPQELQHILASTERNQAGANIAPHGLYFAEAGYRPWKD